MEGAIISSKPGVINMPSWKGVMSDAQASAIAAYALAGFPHVGPEIDFNVAKASDIYSDYACIVCPGQVGQKGAPNPLASGEKEVPGLRNPADTASLAEFTDFLMNGSVVKGKKGVLFMPAWGQILSVRQLKTVLPYIQDGAKARQLPAPPSPEPLLSPAAAPSPAGSP
jgi:mono/diheme cytochrome c family protein